MLTREPKAYGKALGGFYCLTMGKQWSIVNPMAQNVNIKLARSPIYIRIFRYTKVQFILDNLLTLSRIAVYLPTVNQQTKKEKHHARNDTHRHRSIDQ
jgi:hypothetical protein